MVDLTKQVTAELDGTGTATLSDVLGGKCVMDERIKWIAGGNKMVGTAFTVRAYPGSIGTVHKALIEARAGDVLVISSGGDVGAGALLGELMSTECRRKGFSGVVVDGGVRDTEGLNEVGLPIFARGVTPAVGSNRRIGQTQIEISCGGQIVRPGDWIIGDRDGVVVIAAENRAAVVNAAREQADQELSEKELIRNGTDLADLLGIRESLMAAEKRNGVEGKDKNE